MGTLRIATVNVNGIRAAVRRGFGEWLAARSPDVVALQEMRCPDDQLPGAAWPEHQLVHDPGLLAGRNGVAVLTRWTPSAVRRGFGSRVFDGEGRYIEVDLEPPDAPPLTIGSLYLPKGGRPGEAGHEPKLRRKARFLASFGQYLTRARRLSRSRGREFLVLGDVNIAHTRDDLANPGANTRMPGFLPFEREWLARQLGPRTLVDVVRALHPEVKGPYSWWLWRPGAFDRDIGWRIDYHLASPGLARAAVWGGTDRQPSYDRRMSDHSPVVVDYRFSCSKAGASTSSTDRDSTSSTDRGSVLTAR